MEKINLTKSYAKLNESLAKQFDGSGVKRSFTVPYTNEPMNEHIAAVGQAASQSGGLTANLLTSFHHSDGKGWGSDEGSTQGHPSDKLRTTIIPKDSEEAKATIEAAQKHLDNIGKLIGEDNPAVVTANSQLNLVKKSNAAGMNLLDFGVMMTQIMHRPTQMVAQAHDQTKDGGMHPKLRGPARRNTSVSHGNGIRSAASRRGSTTSPNPRLKRLKTPLVANLHLLSKRKRLCQPYLLRQYR